ncbi:MAG: hypothetical protein ACI9FU_001910 [Granulosicoccus sp.]
MRSILFFLIIGLGVNASAQQLSPFLSGSVSGHTIGLYGNAQAASNALSVKFTRDIYTGQFLERELRQKQSVAVGSSGIVGGQLNYGLYYRHLPDSVTSGWGWGINAGATLHANAKFTKDAYDLAMFGNAQFADKTADMSGLTFNFYDYKKFGAAVIKDFSLNTGHFRVALGVNFLLAQKHASARFDKASLFTQEFGEYLDLSLDGTVQSNGMSDGRYFGSNGYGVSADLLLQLVRRKHTLSLELADMGAVFMSNAGKEISLDTMSRFEGLELDLFSTNSEPFSGLSPDSLTSLFGMKNDSGAYSATLPFSIHARTEHKLANGKYIVFGGIKYRFAPFFPLIYVGATFSLPKKFTVQPAFAWGGYGSWNVGLEIGKRFANVASIKIGTNNLEGLIVPAIATGQGGYLTMEFHF